MKLESCAMLGAALMFPLSLCAEIVPLELEATATTNKLGLVLNEYSLAWHAPDQASYQVLVASDERRLDLEVGDLWDSGRRTAPVPADPDGEIERITCRYRGRALEAGRTVWWKVRGWTREGEGGAWSKSQKIEVPLVDLTVEAIPRRTSTQGKIEYIEGRDGKAVRLGAGAQIAADDYEGLRSPNTTIAAWIKPERVSDSWQCIYRKEDGARRLLAIGKEGPFWGLWCGFVISGKYVELGAPYEAAKLHDGKWHHVAATYSGAKVQLYVDGVKIGEKAQRGALSSGRNAPASIGSDGGGAEQFHGGIDDLRIYDGGLDGAEVRRLSLGKAEGIDDAIVAHWKFDGTTANEVVIRPEVTRKRIALVGGSLIYGMESNGEFETAITARWPHHEITFRNLGWPADDVFGTARGEFGSARGPGSWRPSGSEPGAGYKELVAQVRGVEATTLIVGYGAEAAYAETAEQLADFQAGYDRLLDDLESTGVKLILLTPLLQPAVGPASTQVLARNGRLKKAGAFIKESAAKRGHEVVDLQVHAFADSGVPVFKSAIELSSHGYRVLAKLLARSLGVHSELEVAHLSDMGVAPRIRGKGIKVENVVSSLHGVRFDLTLDQLPAIASPVRLEGAGLFCDGELIGHASKRIGTGILERGPDTEQLEELRQLIIQKNQFHRRKLRPLNKTYIFLFRRHEMGHFAQEMEEYDQVIAAREEQIAHLRVPRTHRFEFRIPRDWSAPRDYPDHEVPKEIPVPDPKEELAAFTVAEGLQVNLFAKNPMVANPINLNWDLHGRAWVSTSSTYPHPRPGEVPNDRIVILEDIDLDGVADKHTVFADGLLVPHSVMPVPGGAYVCSATELLFLADRNGDDVADSREVLLSGFGNADVHHMIHGLRWAPWGDLHFTQSIYINSFIDTPHGQRRMNGSGIWRFRPETKRLESFAFGMVNPWGFAFDRWGQSFATDGAAGSGPHYAFPGSAFRSAVGMHRVLDGLMPGKPNNTGGEFVSGRHLPEHWRGSFIGNDFRANRTVRYEIEEKGSGYTAKEVETVLHSKHRSFRPVDLKMGPDGALYVVDWYNAIIDHGEVDFYHPLRDKSHGRIWRITAKDRALLEPPRIAGAPLMDLLELLKAPEDYTRNQVRRELASRPCQGMIGPIMAWINALDRADPRFEQHRLEGLWLLISHRIAPPGLVEEIMGSPSPQARAAAARAVSIWDSRTAQKIDQLALLAQAVEDEHPQVRLEAVNGLRALDRLEATNIALRALSHPTDNNLNFALERTVRATRDHWLPALEAGKQLFDGNPARLSYALKEVNDRRAVTRLLEIVKAGEIAEEDLPAAVSTVAALGSAGELEAVLQLATARPVLLAAVSNGAATNGAIPMNAELVLPFVDAEEVGVAVPAARLVGRWKVAEARPKLVARAIAAQPDPKLIAACLQALAEIGAGDELKQFAMAGQALHLRAAAIAAWARHDPKEAAEPAVELLSTLEDPKEAEVALRSFLAREEGPAALAVAMKSAQLRQSVAIASVRLARASGREVGDLVAALNKSGKLKPMVAQLTPGQRKTLLQDVAKSGDVGRGREVFQRETMACAVCHLVDNKGGRVGPDLSAVGSYATPDSLLESLLNPSAAIKQGYQTVLVTRKDGSVHAGLLQRETSTATLLRDPGGKVISIPSDQVARIDRSPVSLMPPGLTAQLRRDELVDLLRYLTSLGTGKP